MRIIALILAAACGFTACSSEAPPTDPAVQAERADPKGNPLEGTVLDAQGEALQKARGVEDTLQQSEQQRRAEIDEQSR